jgi:hypothetical protein
MTERIKLKIYDIVGGSIWVAAEDGQKVYEKIKAAFDANHAIDLSFAQRENLITAFLNASIGQLYTGEYSDEFLSKNLSFVEIEDDDRDLLQRAVNNAKRYFSNRSGYDQAWGEVVDEE